MNSTSESPLLTAAGIVSHSPKMKYKLYALLATGLVFGLASCREASKTEPAPAEETSEEATAESTPTEQTPSDDAAAPAEPSATSEVAKQVSGKLVRYAAATESFIEAQVDDSIDYYLVSLSASW